MQILNLNIYSVLLFFVICIIVSYFIHIYITKQKQIHKESPGISSGKYFSGKYIFLVISFVVILLSIFSIKIYTSVPSEQKGIDIVFVLDVSKSMNVGDISDYTRLDFSKAFIGNFVTKNPQNRYGLVIFSGEASSTIPLTYDKNVFLSLLENVDYRNLTKQGSNFYEAIKFGTKRLKSSDDISQALVFISDGGDGQDMRELQQKLTKMKTDNIHYLVMGVGTKRGGKIIKGIDVFGNVSYQKYQGEYVISKINEPILQTIASALGGSYQKIDTVSDISNIYAPLEKVEKKVFRNNASSSQTDISRLLAMVSFFFFMMYMMIVVFEKKKY